MKNLEKTLQTTEIKLVTENERKGGKMKAFNPAGIFLLCALIIGLSFAPSVYSQEETDRPVLSAETRVMKVSGAELIPVTEKEIVRPGDVLLYELTYTNIGKSEATNIEFVYPVPEGMSILEEHTKCEDCIVQYSLDGNEFSAPPILITEIVEGKPVEKIAKPAQYRLVKWIVKKPLHEGGKTSVSFKASVEKVIEDKNEKGGAR
jgi:uncharacterized repeat protein (TIGR01451 family)